jgi:hypothetical protein
VKIYRDHQTSFVILRKTITGAIMVLGCCLSHAAERFKPEQMVVSVKGKPLVACMEEEGLIKFVSHLNAGEKTKASAMLEGSCFFINPGQVYKVLAIRQHVMEIGFIGQKSADGVWALPEAFAPAQR